MKAKEFVGTIKEFAPNASALRNAGFSEKFAHLLAKSYTYSYLGELTSNNDEIIKLISNYDMSDVEIGMICFEKSLTEEGDFFIFGRLETDPLGINKKTGEVVLIDQDDPSFVMSRVAINSESFLGALFELWKADTNFLLDQKICDDDLYREKIKSICTILAGGVIYGDFYENILLSHR